ncbi:hypothetical protein EV361DRAFT_311543 [Lentinula raphanica]|nr:hypothetical protein EV361DRAFT_311543 [Lentinula raphanica]
MLPAQRPLCIGQAVGIIKPLRLTNLHPDVCLYYPSKWHMNRLKNYLKNFGLACWRFWCSLTIYISVFDTGITVFMLVWIKLVWNVLQLVLQSQYWLLGGLILGPGAGAAAALLISGSSPHRDIRNLYPKAFVFATVVIGIWMCVFYCIEMLYGFSYFV